MGNSKFSPFIRTICTGDEPFAKESIVFYLNGFLLPYLFTFY